MKEVIRNQRSVIMQASFGATGDEALITDY